MFDFTKEDGGLNSLSHVTPVSINIPNNVNESEGKSILISLAFGSNVPTITWSNNIIWNTYDHTAPSFEALKTTVISLTQTNSQTKYVADVIAHNVKNKDLFFPRTRPPIRGDIYVSSFYNGASDDGEGEDYLQELLGCGYFRILTEAILHFGIDTTSDTFFNWMSILLWASEGNIFGSLDYPNAEYINAYGYIIFERYVNSNYLSDAQALAMVQTNGPVNDYYVNTEYDWTFMYSPFSNYAAKIVAENTGINNFVNLRFPESLDPQDVWDYMSNNGISYYGIEDDRQTTNQIFQEEMDELNLLLNREIFETIYPSGIASGFWYIHNYGTNAGIYYGTTNTIRSDSFAQTYWNRNTLYKETTGKELSNVGTAYESSITTSKGEFCILEFDEPSMPQYVLLSTFDLTKNGLLFSDIDIEVNSSNTRRCTPNKYVSLWASSVGDCTVDCYEFTNTTDRDALIDYFEENAEEVMNNAEGVWLPVEVVLH